MKFECFQFSNPIFELIILSCKNSNREWYSINSKVKVDINDVDSNQ